MPGLKVAVATLEEEPTLLMEWEGNDVQQYPVPVLGKKGALRFATGEPGRRATVWRLWTTANADDVYLASRQSAGDFKVSLHQSGDWRIQAIDLRKDNHTHFSNLDPERGRSFCISGRGRRQTKRDGHEPCRSAFRPSTCLRSPTTP